MSQFSGFNALRRRVLESWVVEVGKEQITPGPATATYRPHIFERQTPPVREIVFVPEGLRAMSISLQARESLQGLRFLLYLETSYFLFAQAQDYVVFRSDKAYMERAKYLALVATRTFQWDDEGYEVVSHQYYFDEHRLGNFTTVRGEVRGSGFLVLGDLLDGEEIRIVVGVGGTEAEAMKRALDLRNDWTDYVASKETRLAGLVNDAGFTASSESLSLALNFALTSLDSLLVEESFGEVIWAGLPWFNQGWGRDTFISLRGGLATGRYAETQSILRSFAAFQRDSDGRIPNLISDPANPPYNSADAIWWFVKVVYEHFLYTGNLSFVQEMYPTVSKALRAGFETYGDDDGLLTSAGKETWMDTSADRRSGKPVEIQALWINALSIGVKIAAIMGLEEDEAFFREVLLRASASFNEKYWSSEQGYLVDYLDTQDRGVSRFRPNAFLAYSALRRSIVSDEIAIESLQGEMLHQLARTAIEEGLLSPWGVRSLSPGDPLYRSRDTSTWDSPAYHNGNVWPWLSGSAMEVLAETHHFEEADVLLRAYEQDFLSRGNVGSGTEIFDGVSSAPKGTWTQAWSAAEFLRAFHQVVLGIRPSESGLIVSPTPLPSVGNVGAPVTYRDKEGHVDYSVEGGKQRLRLESEAGMPLQIRLKMPPDARAYSLLVRDGSETTDLEGEGPTEVVFVNFTGAKDVEVTLVPLYDLGVELLAPKGGEVLSPGGTYDILWDSVGQLPEDQVYLFYSTDELHEEWVLIASAVENTGSYAWQVPDVDKSTVRVKVQLQDAHGNSVSDISQKDFRIAESRGGAPPETVVFLVFLLVALVMSSLATFWFLRRRSGP